MFSEHLYCKTFYQYFFVCITFIIYGWRIYCHIKLHTKPMLKILLTLQSQAFICCFSIRPPPHSVHKMDRPHLISNYSIVCFLLFVQCAAPWLIYCKLFKLCYTDNFLVGFSMMLITIVSECFTNIN